jgi:hypothetical protein
VLARFGDEHYPAFVQLLCAVQQFGDQVARAIVAETLAEAIGTGRMPAGRLPAWGGSTTGGALRRVGPIEFLCAWQSQTGPAERLQRTDFEFCLQRLIELFNTSPRASRLYADALIATAGNPLEGAFSRATRALLETVARRWRAGEPPIRIAAQATVTPADTGSPFGAPMWQPR